jgi:hypothetical protein
VNYGSIAWRFTDSFLFFIVDCLPILFWEGWKFTPDPGGKNVFAGVRIDNQWMYVPVTPDLHPVTPDKARLGGWMSRSEKG